MDDLRSLRIQLNSIGVATTDTELAVDDGTQITILRSFGGKQRRAFCIALRPEGAFILGFYGCFRLEEHGDLVSTVATLASNVTILPDSTIGVSLDFSTLPIQPYSYRQWFDDGKRRTDTKLQESGWSVLPDVQDKTLWTSVCERLSFQTSTNPQERWTIREPTPSATWSVKGVRTLHDTDTQRFAELDRDSKNAFLRLLIDIGASASTIYALDLNHRGFSFDPNVVAQSGHDSWPVTLIPLYNYSTFVDGELAFGLFGHPWEEVVCVFGASLVDRLLAMPLPCFGEMLRHRTP